MVRWLYTRWITRRSRLPSNHAAQQLVCSLQLPQSWCISWQQDSHGNTRTPLGQLQDLHGSRTYTVNPPSGPGEAKDSFNTIILLTNVFGPEYIHNQLVADEWAQEGFKVVVPDLLEGDPLPNDYITVSPNFLAYNRLCSISSQIKINGMGIRPLHLTILNRGWVITERLVCSQDPPLHRGYATRCHATP